MTRFLMSLLGDSVDLVLHAFEHGQQDDLFVQKAPASTVGIWLRRSRLLAYDNPVRVMIFRYGAQGLREEMAKAEGYGVLLPYSSG